MSFSKDRTSDDEFDELDYEFSEDETEDYPDSYTFEYSPKFENESHNDPKSLIREFVDQHKVEKEVLRRRWRCIFRPNYLKPWRLRSSDHLFNIRRKNFRLKEDISKYWDTGDAGSKKEIEKLSSLTFALKNDLCNTDLNHETDSSPSASTVSFSSDSITV